MRFLFRTLLTGFFATLPVFLIYLLIGQLFDLMVALTQPLQDLLPESAYAYALDPRLRDLGLLILFLLLVGLAARTKAGRRLGQWLEDAALSRLPLYSMLRNLAARFSGNEQIRAFRPALVETWPGMKTIAFIVEEHENGDYTIFMPIAPSPSFGYVCIIEGDKVEILEASASEALSAVLSWGDGAATLSRTLK